MVTFMHASDNSRGVSGRQTGHLPGVHRCTEAPPCLLKRALRELKHDFGYKSVFLGGAGVLPSTPATVRPARDILL